jgi:hypothetical protein
VKCACLCGEEFEPKRSNQIYVNAKHRKRDSNRRWPVKRQSASPEPSRNGLRERGKAETSHVTSLLGETVAQTKQQRRNEAMRKQESSEFLSPVQVARLLGVSGWSLLLWRKRGFGPQFIRVTRNIIRYPKPQFDRWLASLHRA